MSQRSLYRKAISPGGKVSSLVGSSNGTTLRRVTYKDSATGKVYRFITNELTLPPGLLAFLYKLRWDIEKIFDQVKNKLMEQKAWANSQTAKIQQANCRVIDLDHFNPLGFSHTQAVCPDLFERGNFMFLFLAFA